MRPSHLTWRPLKRAADPADLYRTIVTGLDATPMPAYADALDVRQAWALVFSLEALVPPDHRVPATAVLGEERAGWMILGMHGGGMPRRGRLPAP